MNNVTMKTFDVLVETISLGIMVVGNNGKITRVNSAFKNILGILDKPIDYAHIKGWEIDSNEEVKLPKCFFLRALENKIVENKIIKIKLLNSKIKTILFSAAPIKNHEDNIDGAIVFIQDISENYNKDVEISRVNKLLQEEIENRLSAEEALHNEQELLKAVLDNMQDGIVACNAVGVLTFFNKATRNLLEVQEASVPPEKWSEYYNLYYSDGKTPLLKDDAPLYRALRGEKVQNFEMVIAPKGAQQKRVIANAQAIFNSKGNKIGAISSVYDITEQNKTKEELQKQQFLLQYIINFVPHSIFWKDRESRFLGGNLNFLNQALGVNNAKEMLGKNDYDYFPKEQADYFRKCDAIVIEKGEPMLDIEEPQNQRERGVRILLTSKVPLRNEKGDIIGVLGSFADITERKRMEQELEETKQRAQRADKIKSEFIAMISHELRTPLTLILGPLETLLSTEDYQLSDKVKKELVRIQKNAARLLTLVNDILDFTKIEAGKAQVYWESVNVNELVEEIISDTESMAKQKNIQVRLQLDGTLTNVPLDYRKFEKIVLNLISNAIKFTPVNGEILVELKAQGDKFEFSVKDSGLGIAQDQQKNLFQKFQQLDSSATRKYEGTGLGLALVKEFTELMGGHVGLESEPGLGSRFFVQLAKESDRATIQQPSSFKESRILAEDNLAAKAKNESLELSQQVDSTAPWVLVVEDNPDMRTYITDILHDEYWIITAENGVKGLERARERAPDVILSDIMMPEMDGLELVKRLKEDPSLKNIPIILLTAKASRNEIIKGLNVGADDYLSKPFDPHELKARIKAAERLHRTLRELENTLAKLQTTQDELFQASKMAAMGTLVAGLSHELNNPLSAIFMSTRKLLSEVKGERTEKYLKIIDVQTSRCAHLVKTLLNYSRKTPQKHERISLANLLNRILELEIPVARHKEVEIKINLNEKFENIFLWVNVQEIETALINIISNAIDASKSNTSVLIEAKLKENEKLEGVEISIIDHGEGIPKNIVSQIFDPFFTTKPVGKGTGLGLSLTKRFIESHLGKIKLESKVDVGTSIYVWLPIEKGVNY